MSVLSELDVSGDRDAAVKESIQDYSRICEYKILTTTNEIKYRTILTNLIDS